MSIQNRIFKNGRQWELISGPWTIAEAWLMAQHIEGFKPHIDCITEELPAGTYVYRCAKGYKNLHDSQKPYYPEDKRKPKLSEFRQLQKERQRDIQRSLCEK